MNDREMLELVAKAAGVKYGFAGWTGDIVKCRDYEDGCGSFDPLNTDGDAFRLAVKLNFVTQSNCSDEYDNKYAAVYLYDDGIEKLSVRETYTENPCAAMRRAIFRAAAEYQLTKENA